MDTYGNICQLQIYVMWLLIISINLRIIVFVIIQYMLLPLHEDFSNFIINSHKFLKYLDLKIFGIFQRKWNRCVEFLIISISSIKNTK